MSLEPSVRILLPLQQSTDFLEESLRSILTQSYSRFDCLLVDARPADAPSLDPLPSGVLFSRRPEQALGGLLNDAVAQGEEDILAVIRPDSPLLPGCLQAMVEAFSAEPGAGAMTADWLVLDENGLVLEEVRESAPSNPLFHCEGGPILFFRRSSWQGLGGFDPCYQHLALADFYGRAAADGSSHRIGRLYATQRFYRTPVVTADQAAQHAREHLALLAKISRDNGGGRDDFANAVEIAATVPGLSSSRRLSYQLRAAAQSPGGFLRRRRVDIANRTGRLLESLTPKGGWRPQVSPFSRRSAWANSHYSLVAPDLS